MLHSLDFKIIVSHATIFLIGFPHPKAWYFLLHGQKKVSKEKAARTPLTSCALPLSSGVAKWGSCPIVNARHPCRAPTGYSRWQRQCSARYTGVLVTLRVTSVV